MNSAVYRLVVNVQSDRAGADPKIRIAIARPRAAGAAVRRGLAHAGARSTT